MYLLNRNWGRNGNDVHTRLLLSCDGTDGGTTFIDDSRSHHTVTANGDAQLDTAQKKFGSASLLLGGDSDYLSVPDHADWNMGSDPFTIDFWIRFKTLGTQYIFAQYEDDDNGIYLWIQQDIPNYKLYFAIEESAATIVSFNKAWAGVAIDTWYHVALIRGWGGNANDWAITIDGTQIGTTETDSDTWPDLAGIFYIGWTNSLCLDGWIDEFRVSKGVARWTANFTPPSAPYK